MQTRLRKNILVRSVSFHTVVSKFVFALHFATKIHKINKIRIAAW